MTPINPIVEALVCRLAKELREAFEERAGIMQFEAGQPRELAEPLALLEVIRLNPLAVSEVSAFHIHLRGTERTVLTCDAAKATHELAHHGLALGKSVDLAQAVRRCGAVAVLASLE